MAIDIAGNVAPFSASNTIIQAMQPYSVQELDAVTVTAPRTSTTQTGQTSGSWADKIINVVDKFTTFGQQKINDYNGTTYQRQQDSNKNLMLWAILGLGAIVLLKGRR